MQRIITIAATLLLLYFYGSMSLHAANMDIHNSLSGATYNDSESFCDNKGSLHQVDLDMFNYSSPPGSQSYKKMKHVLGLSPFFYVNMGAGLIFGKNQDMMKRMMRGMDLVEIDWNPSGPANITLVETFFTRSTCPLSDGGSCLSQPRIFIQTEQKINWNLIDVCHDSPTCVILEFSDHNLNLAKNRKRELLESYILLPVMTQTPSRMVEYEPKSPKVIQKRSIDMAFFGLITNRRTGLTKGADLYRKAHPDRTVIVQKNNKIQSVGTSYREAKVCLLAHSYSSRSGGEYHRMSEFAPFGCIPVMEHFSDTFGIDVYERCGGAIFTNFTNLISVASNVIAQIDQGLYNNRSNDIVNWWKAGIHWESILPTIFPLHLQ